jgi:hypothetical protein
VAHPLGQRHRRCQEHVLGRGPVQGTRDLGDDEGLLTEQDGAELLQVQVSTLRRWHREGTGPPCLEIGRLVRTRRPLSNGG